MAESDRLILSLPPPRSAVREVSSPLISGYDVLRVFPILYRAIPSVELLNLQWNGGTWNAMIQGGDFYGSLGKPQIRRHVAGQSSFSLFLSNTYIKIMPDKKISRFLDTALLPLAFLGLTGHVQAASIEGTQIEIGSSLNDGPFSYQMVTVDSTKVEIDSKDPSKKFSWMTANTADSIDFLVDSTVDVAPDKIKNRFFINIDSGHNFSDTDKLNFSVRLDNGWTFGAAAITHSISVTLPPPGAKVDSDLLTFTLQGLDQIDSQTGNGKAGFVFFANAPQPVPLPGAVWMFGSALLGVVGTATRRKAGTASA